MYWQNGSQWLVRNDWSAIMVHSTSSWFGRSCSVSSWLLKLSSCWYRLRTWLIDTLLFSTCLIFCKRRKGRLKITWPARHNAFTDLSTRFSSWWSQQLFLRRSGVSRCCTIRVSKLIGSRFFLSTMIKKASCLGVLVGRFYWRAQLCWWSDIRIGMISAFWWRVVLQTWDNLHRRLLSHRPKISFNSLCCCSGLQIPA